MAVMTSELLEKFKRCVYDKSDLHFSGKKLAFFERRLCERLEKSGLSGYEAYYSYLVENPSEVYALIEDLTTNQTYFFRNAGQFTALREKVIPALVEEKNRQVVRSWGRTEGLMPGRHPAMSIRVWSAGCSTGEEAYSIAFTLLGAIKYPRAWDLGVLGTDIKREVLNVARRAVYSGDTLRAVEPAVRDAFMERSQGGWTVGEVAKRLVTFYAANIKDVTGPDGSRLLRLEDEGRDVSELDVHGRFDVIFCRNVMIYFDRGGQQRLVDALYDCLRPGGYLFTGDSEPLHLFSHRFERADDAGALYYKKQG